MLKTKETPGGVSFYVGAVRVEQGAEFVAQKEHRLAAAGQAAGDLFGVAGLELLPVHNVGGVDGGAALQHAGVQDIVKAAEHIGVHVLGAEIVQHQQVGLAHRLQQGAIV